MPFGAEIKREIEKAIICITDDEHGPNDCCDLSILDGAATTRKQKHAINRAQMAGIVLYDQYGQQIAFEDFFSVLPSVVVFFYTRCSNPNKCSLTITKMGQLQVALKNAGLGQRVKTAAITYDPGYDHPARLQAYAENRGFSFDENNRAFSMQQADFEKVKHYFQLGVNFSGSIVNLHRVELYILDNKGALVYKFVRLQWSIAEVVECLRAHLAIPQTNLPLHPKRPSKMGHLVAGIWSVIPPIVVAFFPKCPVCWAAYLSMFGISSLSAIPYSPWLMPVFVVIICINLFALARRAARRNFFIPFYTGLAGALLLLGPGLLLKVQPAMYAGIFGVFSGSLLNSIPYKTFMLLKAKVHRSLYVEREQSIHK